MKIYTKTGDKGETSLFGGKRISKEAKRIEAYGTVDELNSVIGIARSFLPARRSPDLLGRRCESPKIDQVLEKIQDFLFILGADLATPADTKSGATKRIADKDCTTLEKIIDELEEELPPLKSFILPGGSKCAAMLHYARTVCRRAERQVVSMRKETSEYTIIFLNRLSDLLFVLARYANKLAGIDDVPWNPR